jgi:hypothetical protein
VVSTSQVDEREEGGGGGEKDIEHILSSPIYV